MKRPSVAIAYNPKSGSFRQKRLDALAVAFGEAGYDTQFIDSYDPELTAVAAKVDQLCVSGGDGTVRDVIARLAAQSDGGANNPKISVFPGGTINLVAREALYPADIKKFIRRVTKPSGERNHHYGMIDENPMLVCASVGPDSSAVASVSEALKRRIGRFAYAAAFGKLLWQWPRHKLAVRADAEELVGEAAFVLKGRYFAGPWMIRRDADLTSPHFQLLVLPRAGRLDYLRLMASAIIHPALADRKWQVRTVTQVEIDGEISMPVQVDGDIVTTLPVRATISDKISRFV